MLTPPKKSSGTGRTSLNRDHASSRDENLQDDLHRPASEAAVNRERSKASASGTNQNTDQPATSDSEGQSHEYESYSRNGQGNSSYYEDQDDQNEDKLSGRKSKSPDLNDPAMRNKS